MIELTDNFYESTLFILSNSYFNFCFFCFNDSMQMLIVGFNYFLFFSYKFIINSLLIVCIIFLNFLKVVQINKNFIDDSILLFYNWYFNLIYSLEKFNCIVFLKNILIFFINYKNMYISYIYEISKLNNIGQIKFYKFYSYNFYINFFMYNNSFAFLNYFFYIINLLFIIYFILSFMLILTNIFNSCIKEELTVDLDYFSSSVILEIEKEIGAFDDIVLSLIFFFFLFFWYFYINFFFFFSNYIEIAFIFILLPLLYVIILLIPSFLLFDFGINFTVFLKGSSTSYLLILEFIFDLISISVFYTRLVIQSVRLILMLFTFGAFNELVIYFNYSSFFVPSLVKSFSLLFESKITNVSYNLFIINNILLKFVHFLYELFHMFFVITIQSLAFFAMVFWLFLFLYTFFVSEKIEIYFYNFRKYKKIVINL